MTNSERKGQRRIRSLPPDFDPEVEIEFICFGNPEDPTDKPHFFSKKAGELPQIRLGISPERIECKVHGTWAFLRSNKDYKPNSS